MCVVADTTFLFSEFKKIPLDEVSSCELDEEKHVLEKSNCLLEKITIEHLDFVNMKYLSIKHCPNML